ncbi:unnamed protein product [Polarella glacialis]|uniref:Uncharacterized protein n=1 Tax=Polarella glacialis TaxID=89957 RepID=A0A813H3C8_POLGL|nr:unnamed protein product [Polarella glacialis]CAE8647529.1 unnamed protein product [Polarella glacialis]
MAPKAKPRASAQRSRSSSSQVTSITRRAGPKSKSKVPAENAGGGAPENIWKDLQRSPTPELSREEEAAQRLQAACRGWLARLLEARRDREAELAEVMHAAEKHGLRVERQAEELALQREADRKRQKEELEKNIEAFVLTAFDGDVQEVLPLLEAGVPIDSRSRRDNTALSEAACGGNSEMVRMLLQRRGNPNSRCEFLRTPIWRAAYRGHTAVVQMLLESGGDPRISSECAEMPTDVAAEKESEGT